MRAIRILVAGISSLAILPSCNDKGRTISQNNTSTTITQEMKEVDTLKVMGNYVNADYSVRSKGYDWLAVIVSAQKDSTITVKVRSRSDRKKPTCTLNAIALKARPSLYRAVLKEGNVLFTFSDSNLTIAPEEAKDEAAVYFYCSGGASFAGIYSKLIGSIDTTINASLRD